MNYRLGLVVLVIMQLAACGGDSWQKTLPEAMEEPVPEMAPGGTTTPDNEMGSPEMIRGTPEQALLSRLVVYFDFDQSDIRSEFNALLTAHGRYLANNPRTRIRLEGHGDERGSREYNIGLGERRAQAVRRALLLQGAATDQLSTVSFGEERPAVSGSDEEAWAMNRRVELVYR
jgi:peptidoglycan-associated lipoprotein